METMENIIMGIFTVFMIIILVILVWAITIPFHSEKKEYCKAWNEEDGKIVCVAKGTYFCLNNCN